VQAYSSVSFHEGVAVSASKKSEGKFEVSTNCGSTFESKRVILATGVIDQMIDIPGLKECWGKTVIHCPFCHGYEFRNEVTAILALNAETTFPMLPMVRSLTDKITLFTNANPDLVIPEEQKILCAKNGVKINEKKIKQLNYEQDGQLVAVEFEDGSPSEQVKVMYAVTLPFTQSSDIATQLGCEITPPGFVKVSPMQETTTPGVFACGDCTTMFRTLPIAIAAGNMAAAVIHKMLSAEEYNNAL
jgi:thioredoxin reductase